jgi:hypothetical protein
MPLALNPSDPSDLLTEPAKRAIRSYMLKVATPSAIVLSVISAILGFLLNEWARGEAYVKAYNEASKSIIDTATAAAKSSMQVELLLSEIKKSSETVASQADQITKSKIQVDEFLTKNFDGIAQTLLQDDKFRNSLVKVDQQQFGNLESKLAALSATIPSAADFALVHAPSSPQHVEFGCPAGTVLISAACTNDRGAQTAVGPTFLSNGQAQCQRYATATLAEGTAICMKLKN